MHQIEVPYVVGEKVLAKLSSVVSSRYRWKRGTVTAILIRENEIKVEVTWKWSTGEGWYDELELSDIKKI